MIKFFRKIRQNLLSEGKTGKYFKYAIGEIVLVIIGILIALQLNEWNGQRIEIKTLNNNLEYIIEDLIVDKIQLLRLKGERQESVKICSNFIERYLRNQEIILDFENDGLGSILYEKKFQRRVSGFEKVESSKLFQSTEYIPLREKIDEYANEIDRLVYDETRLNYFIEEMEREMFSNGSFDDIYERHREFQKYANNKSPLPELDLLEILKGKSAFKAILLRFEDDATRFLIPQYEKIEAVGNELKLEIEKYLSEK